MEFQSIATKGTPWSGLEEWVDNDPESLADAIRSISTMPLPDIGRRGREWMQSEFSWRSVTNQMLALCHQGAQRYRS